MVNDESYLDRVYLQGDKGFGVSVDGFLWSTLFYLAGAKSKIREIFRSCYPRTAHISGGVLVLVAKDVSDARQKYVDKVHERLAERRHTKRPNAPEVWRGI